MFVQFRLWGQLPAAPTGMFVRLAAQIRRAPWAPCSDAVARWGPKLSTGIFVRENGHVRTLQRSSGYGSTGILVRLSGVLAKISYDIHRFCGSRFPQILLFIYSDHSLDTKSQGLRCARYSTDPEGGGLR